MGNPVTLQRLLAMQRKIWRFRLDSEAKTAETVAREQLKSISQISRIGSLISIPGTSYIVIKICMHADFAFAAFTMFCVAVMAFASIRNYRRQARVDHDRIDYEKSVRMIIAEAKLNAAFASALVAVPLAFGQIPMGLDVAILGIGTVIIGGFIFGSIPRAQTWYMGIATISFAGGFFAAEGTSALAGIALFVFVALCTDYIYRMFFFNFVQRHIHAAREKMAADTVRLLLHDYAEQSSDWLWEIDDEFRIINPSARFASAAACEIRELRRRHLIDLFEDSTERNFLIQSLESGEAFRDLPVPIAIHGKCFWWKLSGRPTPCTHGSGLHIRGVAADITNAKMA
ncbi:MAG: PAS domain-containing protein, partial [Pseudomonadota bacterium]